jgi:hypothetical protein
MDPEEPRAIKIERRTVSPGASLDVDLATGGGFVAIVRAK